MTQPMQHITYLSQEIGPRPAGSDNENDAALYIYDQFQKEANFPTTIEEFTSSANVEGARAVPATVIVVVSILAMFFHVIAIPAFILALIAAVLYGLEAIDKPIISKLLSKRLSQNVVSRYQPGGEATAPRRGRSRKIVLVAHYDSGRVTPTIIRRLDAMGLPLSQIALGAIIAATVLLLIRIFVGGEVGIGVIILNVLTVIAIILAALPIVKSVVNRIDRLAPLNEGANNNASGVAAILEIARRISRGSVSEADLAASAEDVVIHGEKAARESGLIPEGVQIRYEAERLVPPEEIGDYDEEERLLNAKAAIAALTGKPVERKIYGSVAGNLVNTRAGGERSEHDVPASQPSAKGFDAAVPTEAPMAESAQPAMLDAAAVHDEPSRDFRDWPEGDAPQQQRAVKQEPVSSGFENAPSWFVAAQQNAKRPSGEPQIQRSRYTEAIEGAEREAERRERERQEAEQARIEAERREREETARAAMLAAQQALEEERAQERAQRETVLQPETELQPEPQFEQPVVSARDDGTRPMRELDEIAAAPARESRIQEAPVREVPVEAPAETPVEAYAGAPAREVTAREVPAEAPAREVSAPQESEGEEQPVVDLGSTIACPPIKVQDVALPELEVEQTAQPEPDLRTSVPSVVEVAPIEEGKPKVEENTSPSRSGLFRMLRNDVPSLSGVIRMQAAGEDVSQRPEPKPAERPSVSLPDPAVEKQPRASEPAARDTVDYDMEVPTLDDHARDAHRGEYVVPEPPAQTAGEPVYEQAPAYDDSAYADKRAHVDERAYADEPVRDDERPYEQEPAYEEERSSARRSSGSDPRPRTVSRRGNRKEADSNESRSGGFLSRFRRKKEEELSQTPQEWLDVDDDFDARSAGRELGGWENYRNTEEEARDSRRNNTWEGGGYSRVRLGHVDMRSGDDAEADVPEEPITTVEDHVLTDEIEQIYHFRNPLYNTEIWFAAIGSDNELHDGARALIAEHGEDLRGAMIIEVESLGSGVLSVVTEEGKYRKFRASSRVKRYTRSAVAATGLALGEVKLNGYDSITTTMQKSGYQTMHLTGVEDGQPSFKGSPDDIAENIDEMALEENINFLMELLKR